MADSGSNQSFVPEIEEMLTCQVCLTPLVEKAPRQLKCLHTFCTPCLENVLAKATADRSCIACPICQETTQLSKGKVQDLPLNFTVKQMKEVVQSLGKVECCNTCLAKGDFVNATAKCITCNRRLCNACCTRHNKFPGFDSHPMESLKDNQAQFAPDCCTKHSSKYVHFCAECKSLVCTDCLLSGEHDSHPRSLKGISETAIEARNQITQRQNNLKQQMSKLQDDLDKNMKHDKHLRRVRMGIIQAAEEVLKSIAKQRDMMLQELQNKYVMNSEQNVSLLKTMIHEKEYMFESLQICSDKSDCELLQNKDIWNETLLTVNKDEKGIKDITPVHFIKFPQPIIGRLASENDHSDTSIVHQTPAPTTEKNFLPSTSIGRRPKLLFRFLSCNIDYYGGIGALSNGNAVLLAKKKTGLVLCNSETGSASTVQASRNVLRVSSYKDKILCCSKTIIFEIDISENTLKLIKQFNIPDALYSYLTYDSSCNILITHINEEFSVRKYGPKNNMLWKKYVNTNNYIQICVAGNQKNERYVISFGSGVEVWNEKGQTVHKLNIVKRKQPFNLRGITITPSGTILVADRQNNTISEYGFDGSFIRDVLTEDDGIKNPQDISCDANGRLWITEVNNDNGPLVFKMC